jgi:hypothetical protein
MTKYLCTTAPVSFIFINLYCLPSFACHLPLVVFGIRTLIFRCTDGRFTIKLQTTSVIEDRVELSSQDQSLVCCHCTTQQ